MGSGKTAVSRRRFMQGAAAGAMAFSLVPRRVLAQAGQPAPSDKLNLGCVGVAGRGGDNINELAGQNIVALTDVDWAHAAKTLEKFPGAKRYKDYRKMLDEMDKSIDAVVVSTPDHTHAVAAMAAIKRGKHVYCEKPLAHSVWEVRQLMQAAREHKVVTQLGNQGHSFDHIRMFCEWIWDGAIGKVTEVHARCGSNYSKIRRLEEVAKAGEVAVPDMLDWDLWLGPAQHRPYHRAYLPGQWRGWMPFGCGVIGDWVCHVVDPVFWALKLGAPTSVQARTFDYNPTDHADTFPPRSIVRYDFPARGDLPPVTLMWYDGEARPPRPAELESGRKDLDTGAIVVGDKGKIMYGSHGAGGARIIPESKMKEYKQPAKSLPRVKNHHADWVAAIRDGKAAGSDFSYGGPLTEIALLGVIAMRLSGQRLDWDGANMRFTNSDEANKLLTPTFRMGWSL